MPKRKTPCLDLLLTAEPDIRPMVERACHRLDALHDEAESLLQSHQFGAEFSPREIARLDEILRTVAQTLGQLVRPAAQISDQLTVPDDERWVDANSAEHTARAIVDRCDNILRARQASRDPEGLMSRAADVCLSAYSFAAQVLSTAEAAVRVSHSEP